VSLDVGKKEVPGKEVVSDTKSTTQDFDLASSVKHASPSIKGIGVSVAALETELNQLSIAQREALLVDLKDKLTQETLTPAEQKVLKSVLTALQLSGDDKISLEVKQFVSAKAQDQEVKLSQASALPNDNAKLVDTMAKADVQGLIKGLNEPVETVGKDTKATVNLAETVGKDTKVSVNPAATEQVELKLGSTDAIGQRQTVASDPVNSKKNDDKTDSLVTVNVPLAKKSEDLIDQGADNLELVLEQEQEALIASQNTAQQQTKMADNSASLQRIMQTVTQIAHNNTQFDNAVNVQVFQQIEQVQQQQHSVAHAQKVVMDPAMLEAINIARHDAVKELQNRVSMMLNLNNKEAEIRLDPPELGSLQIRIRTDAETAQVNFVVQNQQAKELLEQSLPKLREMLAEQGINLGESSIEHGSTGQGNTGEGAGKGMNSRVDSDQVEEGAAENLRTTAKTSSSAIDYYA
jgi:flagellar hook-length control protein FliK